MNPIVRLTALAILALSPLAAASPLQTSTDAESLFDDARRLFTAGRIAEACNAFEASHRLSPAIGTLSNLARCREQNQQLATAYGLFHEVERATRGATDARQQRLNRTAAEKTDQLEPRLSKLTIRVSDRFPDLRIRRDLIEINVAVWDKPLPVDGGTYTIVASAPGYREWSTTVSVDAAGDKKLVAVPALVAIPPPVSAPVVSAPVLVSSAPAPIAQPAPLPEPAMPAPEAKSRGRALPLMLSSAAVALLGGAVALELRARSGYDASTREPDDARQLTLFEDAKGSRVMAQGMAVAGVGAAGIAVWMFLRKDKQKPTPIARTGKLAVEPAITSSHLGFQLTNRF